MEVLQAEVLEADRAKPGQELCEVALGAVLSELPLRCVWSGALDACSCRARIGREVVERAWQRELALGGEGEPRFFHFIWDGGVWMAYGLLDGQVRGVYCPAHNSQRAERSRVSLCGAGDVVLELSLVA